MKGDSLGHVEWTWHETWMQGNRNP